MNQKTKRQPGFHAARPVIVVGGGIAGLSAAYALKKRGVAVQVIDPAPDRSGRIHTEINERGSVETGMEFYYGAYKEAFSLLREFGIESELVRIDIRGTMFWKGRQAGFSKKRPWLGLLSTGENLRLQMAVIRQVGALLRSKVFERGATCAEDPNDQIDVVEYFSKYTSPAVVELSVRPMVNSYAFCEPEKHSLAMFVRLLRLTGTSPAYGLRCGNSRLPHAMAERLDVIEGTVTAINIHNGAVHSVVAEREDSSGRSIEMPASAVICAAPAPRAASLFRESSPELAAQLDALCYSSIVLSTLYLDRPIEGPDWVYTFSREAGHQGAFAIDVARRIPSMFPNSNAVIQMNFASPASDALLASRDDTIIKQATKEMELFVPGIQRWVEHAMVTRRPQAHPNFPVGTMSRLAEIERSAESIHGLELAGDYLRVPLCEGAIRSGLRAAMRVQTMELGSPGARKSDASSELECTTTTGMQ